MISQDVQGCFYNVISPPNFSLEWAIAVVMRRRHRRRRQHFRKCTSTNARVLKFCTDILNGSEGGREKISCDFVDLGPNYGQKGVFENET